MRKMSAASAQMDRDPAAAVEAKAAVLPDRQSLREARDDAIDDVAKSSRAQVAALNAQKG